MGWTYADFGRFLGIFWQIFGIICIESGSFLMLLTRCQVISDSFDGQVLQVVISWPPQCQNSQDKQLRRCEGDILKCPPYSLSFYSVVSWRGGLSEWVSEWVGLAGWAGCQSGLPACSLPAPAPALPRKFPLHNPWRHLEMRSWSQKERGKNNNLRQEGFGESFSGTAGAQAFPHDIQIYRKVSWWAQGQGKT